MTFCRLGGVIIAAMMCVAITARSDHRYPSRLITIVAPITAGTAIDILARLYADRLPKHFGPPGVVAHWGGAPGLIGARTVAGAAADRPTFLFAAPRHAPL